MDQFNLYKDIQARTGGEIYLGVVGPVRTGKSTFIKRFMDMMVIPRIADVHSREQAKDELPQSSGGNPSGRSGESKNTMYRLCWVYGGGGFWSRRKRVGADGNDALV